MIAKTANEKQLALVRKEVAEGRITDLAQFNYQEYVKYEDLVVEEIEPIKAQLENFQLAIRTRGSSPDAPEVTGADGHGRGGYCDADHQVHCGAHVGRRHAAVRRATSIQT